MKIEKRITRRRPKVYPRRLKSRVKRILSVVFMLREADKMTIEEIISKLLLISDSNSHKYMAEHEKTALRAYLAKYGYDNSWLD
jgi:hypothetical protein